MKDRSKKTVMKRLPPIRRGKIVGRPDGWTPQSEADLHAVSGLRRLARQARARDGARSCRSVAASQARQASV